ncbi:MAG: protoporphyrinogen oxidase [Acidobacteria bacterium]|nr:protoporphyrinogen oxidase [Acidobacteriota bacterium]
MNPARVLVVGGGITGLSAAFTLQEEARRRGLALDLALLEAADQPGGHARTLREDGFLVEAGPNGFLAREPETLALIDEVGATPRLVEARPEAKRRFIVRGGRLHRVPESPPTFLTSSALSLRGKLRLAAEIFAPGPPEGVDETVFEFARRRIGAEAAEMLVDAAVSGISAGDSRALSVAAQFPMMIEMEREHGGLIKAMIARRKTGPGGSRLLSFDGGLRTLTEALAGRLGDVVRPETAVQSIGRQPSGWRAVTNRGAFDADEILLAGAARASARLVADLDPELAAALDAIPYSGVSLVALAYEVGDVPRELDGYGYLVTRPERLATLGVVWESSLFPGRAPEGMALLRVFLGGARQPGIVAESEAAALAIAREELRRVMGIEAPPARSWVFRWPQAIAQYTVGHLERVAAIRGRVQRHPGLTVCGASYDGVAFNNAIVSGRKAARALAARLEAGAREEAAMRRAV